MITLDGIDFILSPISGKKYRAIFPNGKKVDFGSINHQHYYDKIGYYSSMNHYDTQRRVNYISRHSKIKNSNGEYAINDTYSPAYLSLNYLW